MTDNEKRFIKSIFSGDSSGHDYYHTIRVYKLATKIAKQENADVKTVQLACLLYTSPSPRDAHESRMPSSA